MANLKNMNCPRCHKPGCLIRHGLLTGNAAEGPANDRIVRGQRFCCSGRGRQSGCGKTFSIMDKTVIPHFSISTQVLSLFLKACLQQPCVHAAWQRLCGCFSLSSAYRLWQRLQDQQSAIRTRLWRLSGDPPACVSTEPRHQLIEHLFAAFASHPNPVSAYQSTVQIKFW